MKLTYKAKAAIWLRWITLGCYAGLLLNLLYGAIVYGPEGIGAQLVLWLLFSSGLLLVLPGLLKGSRRSYIWLCFILLFYFIAAVQSLFAGNSQTMQVQECYEVIRVALVVAAFVAAMLASRSAKQS